MLELRSGRKEEYLVKYTGKQRPGNVHPPAQTEFFGYDLVGFSGFSCSPCGAMLWRKSLPIIPIVCSRL